MQGRITASEYLFVYGSLMSGVQSRVAQTLHQQARLVGQGTIRGYLYDLGQYPGLVLHQQAGCVQGHVFRLHTASGLLAFLDEYEGIIPGHPEQSEYSRAMAPVLVNEEKLTCWMYLYNQSVAGLALIESGDYLSYLQNNPVHQAFLQSLRANG